MPMMAIVCGEPAALSVMVTDAVSAPSDGCEVIVDAAVGSGGKAGAATVGKHRGGRDSRAGEGDGLDAVFASIPALDAVISWFCSVFINANNLRTCLSVTNPLRSDEPEYAWPNCRCIGSFVCR